MKILFTHLKKTEARNDCAGEDLQQFNQPTDHSQGVHDDEARSVMTFCKTVTVLHMLYSIIPASLVQLQKNLLPYLQEADFQGFSNMVITCPCA
jgi:hypothetical protein